MSPSTLRRSTSRVGRLEEEHDLDHGAVGRRMWQALVARPRPAAAAPRPAPRPRAPVVPAAPAVPPAGPPPGDAARAVERREAPAVLVVVGIEGRAPESPSSSPRGRAARREVAEEELEAPSRRRRARLCRRACARQQQSQTQQLQQQPAKARRHPRRHQKTIAMRTDVSFTGFPFKTPDRSNPYPSAATATHTARHTTRTLGLTIHRHARSLAQIFRWA